MKLGLVDNPWFIRWKQASEMVSYVLCDCQALVVLRFRNLGHNFLTSGDFADIFLSKTIDMTVWTCVINCPLWYTCLNGS